MNCICMHKRTTKTSIRLMRPAKTQIRLLGCAVRVLPDRMCILQLLGYPKWDEQEPLPYWVDVQADLSLCCLLRSYCRFCRALAHINDVYQEMFFWRKNVHNTG